MGRERVILSSLERTLELGRALGSKLKSNTILTLEGPLGAGKTSFIRGIAESLHTKDLVQSPTFTYLHIYEADIPIYHFDLYRLKTTEDFIGLGFEEYFSQNGICLIEWPQILQPLLPKETALFELGYEKKSRFVKAASPLALKLLNSALHGTTL